MAENCVYKIGDITLNGPAEFKAWLAEGGLEELYPDGSYSWLPKPKSTGGNIKFSRAGSQKNNIDEQYFAAIESGDMDAVQRLVNEQATAKGYANNKDYRMDHRAPGFDDTPLEERVDDGGDFSIEDIANGYSSQPDDYFDRRVGARYYGYDNYVGRQSQRAILSAIEKIQSGEKAKVTIYRAVPKALKESKTRNGDWVTLSEEYAKDHGKHVLGFGQYRIISEEVPAEHVWWDGNDINEWGYDDGKDYAYANTKNNKKSLAPITYDDNGEIIPLSKRFGKNNPDQRFSFAGQNAKTADKFQLANAQSRLENGEDAETVRKETGWHKGVDGKWRFEIDDSKAKLNKPFPVKGQLWGDIFNYVVNDYSGGIKLIDMLEHEALYSAYPQLKDIGVFMQDGDGASFIPSLNSIYIGKDAQMYKVKSTLLHEIQHAIQEQEGFARGGSPMTLRSISDEDNIKLDKLQAEIDKTKKEIADIKSDKLLVSYENKIQELVDSGKIGTEDGEKLYDELDQKQVDRERFLGLKQLREKYASLLETRAAINQKSGGFIGMEGYKRLAGEIEARNTQARAGLTEEQRRATPPSSTQDIPDGDAIVVWNGKEMQSAPANADTSIAKRSVADNAYTKETLAEAIRTQLDRDFGKGWFDGLLKTGKFKIISAAEAAGIIGEDALFHKVWHGSPHDHEGFDSSKIGTGEGAQAFGYGHYFTDAKSIAEWYKDKLSKLDFSKRSDGEPISDALQDKLRESFNYLSRKQSNLDGYDIAQDVFDQLPESSVLRKEASQLLRYPPKFGGKLYEVELAPTQDEYLDWDKLLSEQSELVKNRLEDIGVDNFDMNGAALYNEIANKLQIPGLPYSGKGSDKSASEYLHSIGIRGIRYKAEAGKSEANNYVIFDDADIKIEAKYSKPGAIQAFYNPQDKTTYFIHDNIDKDVDLKGLLLHEIGVHALQLGKGDAEFAAIMDELAKQAKVNLRVKSALRTALRSFGEDKLTSIPEYGKPFQVFDENGKLTKEITRESVLHELGGYLVENHPDLSISEKIIAWFKKAIRYIGINLPATQRLPFYRWARSISDADIVFLATKALQSAPQALVNGKVAGNSILKSATDAEIQTLLSTYANESGAPTRAEMAEALRQYREIESRYFELDGTPKEGAMLAPNGKPTNLNKGQWITVRTDNFKRWFGDWDTDPKNASQVVDENGEPLVVYHGTKGLIESFRREMLGKLTKANSAKKGFFFTSSANNAETYTEIKGENQSAKDFKSRLNENEINQINDLERFRDELKPKKSKYDDWMLSDEYIRRNALVSDLYSKLVEKYSGGGNILPLFLNIRKPFAKDFYGSEYRDVTYDELLSKAIKNKKDGAILKNTYDPLFNDVFVAFDPNQIKSATGNIGTFNPASNDIRFSTSPNQSTSAWRKWFGNSKMRAAGKPIKFYHGTNAQFTVFDKDKLASSTTHPTAALGHFFARDKGAASEYGGTVHEVYLSVQNPYIVNSWNLDIADSEAAVKFRKSLQAKGYDGIYIKDAGYAVVFDSAQAKLTSNEAPTQSPDIRFSQAQEAITETIAPKGKKPLGWLAGLFQRNHLIDFVANELPELNKYKLLAQDKDNFVNKREGEISRTYEELHKSLNYDTLHQLGMAMGLATRTTGFDPATFDGLRPLTAQEREALEAYQTLPDNAKEAYAVIRDGYKADLLEKKQALIDRIKEFNPDRETSEKIIKEIEQHFDGFLSGVYFPLSRFGDFIVRAVDPNGERVVSFYSSLGEQEKAANEMRKQGYSAISKTLKTEYDAEMLKGDAAKQISALAYKTINNAAGVSKEESAKLFDEFNQLLINALPDTSYRKHFIHRKGTRGESTDALRAYANTRTQAAKNIAALKYDNKISKTLTDAEAIIKRMDESSDDSDTNALKSVINELRLREQALRDTRINPASQVLTSLGFLGALGFNIGSAAVNMLQVPGVTLPELAGRYSFKDASASLTKAYSLLTNPVVLNKQSGFNLLANPRINQTTKRALQKLSDDGKIDLTLAHDAINQGQNPAYSENPAQRALGLASKYSGYFFHVAEALNRQVTGIAAFELAYKKHGDFDRAVSEAADIIDRTQFDYGQGNRARYMMGNTARVLTLFKAYALGMSYYIGRNAYQSFKGLTPEERSKARKTLVTQMAMTFATSGLFGLPIGVEAFAALGGVSAFRYGGAKFAVPGAIGGILVFQALLAGLGADDEDDVETEFRNWLTDNFDQTTAEWVSKGPARLLPLGDIAGRTGLDQMWWRRQNKELEGADQYNAIANALIGPVGGQLAGWFTAKKMYEDGQYQRMIESMSPAFLRNAIAAERFADEGVKTLKGDKIVDRELTAVEIANKLIGFTPLVIANTYAANTAITKERDKRAMRKAHLINRYILADAEDKRDIMQGDIAEFNKEVSKDERITLKTIMKSIRARKASDKRTQNGLYLGKKHQELREIGRFAKQ